MCCFEVKVVKNAMQDNNSPYGVSMDVKITSDDGVRKVKEQISQESFGIHQNCRNRF